MSVTKWGCLYPSQIKTLSVIAAISLAGFSFVWPLTSLYVTHVMGKSLDTAGYVLSLEALAGICGSFIGGVVQDRIGGRLTIFIFCAVICMSTVTLALSSVWLYYLVAFGTMNFSVGVLSTVINAMAGILWPEGGRRAFNAIYVSRNIGVAFGTALGGAAAASSFSLAFMLASGCFASISVLVIIAFREPRRVRDITNQKVTQRQSLGTGGRTFTKMRIIALLLLGIGVILNLTSYIQWQTTVPVFMGELGISMKFYSLLWTLNGICIIVLQPLTGLFERIVQTERVRMYLGQFSFILSFAVLLVSHRYVGFIIAMLLATLAEMIVWPTVPFMVAEMAPTGREGLYQGIVNVFNYGGRLFGPIIGTVVYQFTGKPVFLIVMVAFYAGAMLAFFFTFYCMKPSNGSGKIPTDVVIETTPLNSSGRS